MVLRAALIRRLLASVGIVAVILTPTAGGPLRETRVAGEAFARTLAPGDHAGVVRRIAPDRPAPTSTERPQLLVVLGVGTLLALLVVRLRRRSAELAEGRPTLKPLLLRAPTRSPPLSLA